MGELVPQLLASKAGESFNRFRGSKVKHGCTLHVTNHLLEQETGSALWWRLLIP